MDGQKNNNMAVDCKVLYKQLALGRDRKEKGSWQHDCTMHSSYCNHLQPLNIPPYRIDDTKKITPYLTLYY
ncbi:hypothetical protein ABD68_00500 [Bacillus endophyticus]|nr:hypothetical protein [Priestia endophytica]